MISERELLIDNIRFLAKVKQKSRDGRDFFDNFA